MLTAPVLLARGLGQPVPEGDQHCYYCGASCDDSHPTGKCETCQKKHVADSFVELQYVARPDSEYICGGCVVAFNEKWPLPGREKPQKIRNYTWFLGDGVALPLTKGDRERIFLACLNPPNPPFALCIAESGQKHLLWKTPVNLDSGRVRVCFEGDLIEYDPAQLAERIALCTAICAALGKPALVEPLNVGRFIALSRKYGDMGTEHYVNLWEPIREEPLTRLAIFLTPKKEDCNVD